MTDFINTDPSEEIILRPKQVAYFMGVSLQTLWRLDKHDPKFPNKIKFTARCVGYKKSDILSYIETRQCGGM